MKYLTILLAAFVAGALGAPKNGATTKATGCGFPDGPDCVATGTENADGLEEFTDAPGDTPGCCLLPLRCGNGDGGEVCIRV